MLKAYYVIKSRNLYVIYCVDCVGNHVEIASGKNAQAMFDLAQDLALKTGLKVLSGHKLPEHLAKFVSGEPCATWLVSTESEPWLTVQEARQIITVRDKRTGKQRPVSQQRIAALIAAKKIVAYKRGNRWCITKASAMEYANSERKPGNKKLFESSPGWKIHKRKAA